MAILMAEDKSRYNETNTIVYEMDACLSGYRSNSSFYTPSVSLRAKNGRLRTIV